MTRIRICCLYVLILSAAACLPTSAADRPPAAGESFPGVVLEVPDNTDLKEYLGLKDAGTFNIPMIGAEVVIVEIFSMYCPHCQREAPIVNRAYEIVESDDQLKGQIKFIGIGAGNSAYEVNLFKKKYNIPFPLFGDGNFVIHEQLGEVRTPYFIGVRINKDGTHRVFYSRLGGFSDPKRFVERMVERSGIQ